ncbi:LOB domain-containing protein 22-like isoform X2 [Cajanus cajan]|uniref:LOB domain-containing protein 22-like isoform X2 n=1 Tax=Cajanus cajan TaxID=3821 RepID=UPI0010FAE9B3|nr:LOB domain-containing protein 22-like isoform X2 [Cajanus cajan]
MDNSMSRSTAQACAACKFQRRKCGSNCILAPYFPHDRQKHFLNARRLFGVGKITNLLKPLDPNERDIAMSTIMYQSDMRARDPVGGCYKLIQHLQSQIEYANAELHLVLQHLAFFRAQAHQNNDISNVTSSQPFLQQMSQEQHQQYQQQQQQFEQQQQQQQFEQQQYVNYNPSLQEDINLWAVQNSISLLPLSLEDDINQDPVVDYDYDQKPVLELMNKIESDATVHPHHSDDEAVLFKVDKAVL